LGFLFRIDVSSPSIAEIFESLLVALAVFVLAEFWATAVSSTIIVIISFS